MSKSNSRYNGLSIESINKHAKVELKKVAIVNGLRNQSDDRIFVQVTFTKNSIPKFWWGDAARQRGMK